MKQLRSNGEEEFLWSRIRPVYHQSNCRFSRWISRRNRESGGLRAAQGSGKRRACRVCQLGQVKSTWECISPASTVFKMEGS